MKFRLTDRILLYISMGGFLLMSASFLLMPVDTVSILSGLLFWCGLVAGVVLQILLEHRRRVFFACYRVKRETMQKPRCGLLTFGSSREAVIIDYALPISFALMILAFILTKGYGYVCYVFIATTLSAFCLHCITNGRIYFHVKNQDKIRQMLEKKKAKTKNKGEGEDEKR